MKLKNLKNNKTERGIAPIKSGGSERHPLCHPAHPLSS